MKRAVRKVFRNVILLSAQIVAVLRPRYATEMLLWLYKREGVQFSGRPNYISSKTWFDGTDFSLISIGEGATISSFVRILTHDWSPHTIFKSLGARPESNIGFVRAVSIGDGVFVGTACVIMPGASIGHHSIVGAGTVVRGSIPPWSIVAGSPGVVIGDVRTFLSGRFPELAHHLEGDN